jgi:hypothetical protein
MRIDPRNRRQGHAPFRAWVQRAQRRTTTMTYHRDLDSELAHLEHVLPHVGRGPFPLSYWRSRIDAVGSLSKLPHYRMRYERLKTALGVLENRAVARSTSECEAEAKHVTR